MPGWLGGLRDVIAEASPARRLMLALLLLLPLLALAAAYFKFNPPPYRVLYSQLSDRAGGEVMAALDQLDIPYRLSATDGTIEVPADALHGARYRLAARGLPKTDDERQDEAERAPSFGVSSLQEQQRFQRALEIDLARSIQKFDAIELARVHLALPRVSPFLRDAPAATAAVLVRLRAGADLAPEQVATIQALVAAAVPRMKREDVQVLDPKGVLLGTGVAYPEQSPRQALEKDLSERVLAVLTPWLGKERVSVQVTATLEASDTRETIEQIRNVVVAGQSRPAEKTVRTTRVPQGAIRQLQAVIILGFDATADERSKAGQMARQVLGLQASRGDSVKVYAIPGAVPPVAVATPASQAKLAGADAAPDASAPPRPSAPASIPHLRPRADPATPTPDSQRGGWWWLFGAGAAVVALVLARWRRVRASPGTDLVVEDFDAELEATRSQVMADPRVAADVIKLWMRA